MLGVTILITAADSALGRALCDRLAVTHRVHSAAWAEPLEADAATDRLVSGVEALVHLAPIHAAQEIDADTLVDYATRRSYNLLQALAAAGPKRVVYVSTLRLFEDYPPHFAVTENWRSRPASDQPGVLASHLGEFVVKEFARDALIEAIALRIGFPLVAGGRAGMSDASGAATALEDAVDGVERALRAGLRQWQTVHLQSPVPSARFLMQRAARLLGFPDGDVPTEPPRLSGS